MRKWFRYFITRRCTFCNGKNPTGKISWGSGGACESDMYHHRWHDDCLSNALFVHDELAVLISEEIEEEKARAAWRKARLDERAKKQLRLRGVL